MKNLIKKCIPDSIIRRRLPPSAGNSILLTFDDGPHPHITPQVLDLLRDHNARAMFFVVGHRAGKHPELLKEIITCGHIIGNHTYSHPNDRTPFLKEYRRDIIRCQDLVTKTTGFTPQFFRPARGKITLGGLLAARSVGLSNIFWTCEGGEWAQNRSARPEEIGQLLLSHVKHRYIILLHDDNLAIPYVLKDLLPQLKEKGLDLNHGVEYLKFIRRRNDKDNKGAHHE